MYIRRLSYLVLKNQKKKKNETRLLSIKSKPHHLIYLNMGGGGFSFPTCPGKKMKAPSPQRQPYYKTTVDI